MREIPLSRGRYVALVDDQDYERIAAHRWHRKLGDTCYAIRWLDGNTKRVRMHREVLGVGSDVLIDHANGNGLDNRRANLRICTAADNARNSRAFEGRWFKGVQRCGPSSWRTRIRIDGRLTHIGTFGSATEAAFAYDEAARIHFGEFACVNFPRTGERPAQAVA